MAKRTRVKTNGDVTADGRTLTGRIWRNGPQAEHPAVLTRLR